MHFLPRPCGGGQEGASPPAQRSQFRLAPSARCARTSPASGGGKSRRTLRHLVLSALLLLAAGAAHAAGDAERGRAKAQQVCAACHGADGNSTLENIPSLAGQPETFTTLQLILFRERIRVVDAMMEVSKPLTDADIADLAAHYARLPAKAPAAPRNEERFKQGEALAERMRCANCHERNYAGREQMPRLAAQREDYLLHSMKQYRDNQRTGTDTTMQGVLHGVSDGDLSALAHYLAQLR
jgi:cytochrome c553